MNPQTRTLAELFQGDLVYVVPSYQRLYVWNQEDQWAPLWSDVEDIANVLVRDAVSRDTEEVDANSAKAHFLGAVVLKVSGINPDLVNHWKVIDGQQRLTTLQIAVLLTVIFADHVLLVFTGLPIGPCSSWRFSLSPLRSPCGRAAQSGRCTAWRL